MAGERVGFVRNLVSRRTRLLWVVVLLALALTGCGVPFLSHPVVITDDQGHTVHLPHAALRVISLAPSATEIMLALGAKAHLVGVDQDSLQYLPQPYAAQVRGITSVGNPFNLSAESLLALKPDLILTAPNSEASSVLAKVGAPVLVLDPKNLPGIYQDINLVGQAVGASRAAGGLVTQMEQQVAAVRARVAQAKTHPRVFYEIDKTLYTAGPGSFVDQMITLAGATNVADQMAASQWPQVSSEQVIAANPNVIILADTDEGVTAASVAARPGWGIIAAVQQGRIVTTLDPSYLDQPGPAIVTGLAQLAAALHPHTFGGH